MATIKDVARASGVSPTTVSFVLNGTGSVGAVVRERVLRAAADLGYSPDPLARAMITRKTRTLGVLVNNVHSFTASSMLSGIEETARRGGYEILLALYRDDAETARSAVRDLACRRVDALIAIFARADEQPDAVEALRQSGIPYLIAYHYAPDETEMDNVVIDHEQGGYLATRYLLDTGRRRVAFAGGPESRSATRGRFAGYRRALAEAGIDVAPCQIAHDEFTVEAGLRLGRRLLDTGEPFDAVFAGDDQIAAGLLRIFRAAGRPVPDDIAVIGFNDSPLCEATDPPLTSVRMALGDIGKRCVERAILRLSAPTEWRPVVEVLPCTLVVRESA